MQYGWPYITLINSHFQLWRKSLAMQQLTTPPKLNPSTSCSGSHSSLTSSTCTHCHQDMWIPLQFPLHHITFVPTSLLFTFSAWKIYWKRLTHHFHSSTYTIDPLTTLYSQNWVGFCSQAASPTLVNFSLRHVSICDAATDHYHDHYPRLTLRPFISKVFFHFKNLFLCPSIVSLISIQQLT